MSLVNYISKSTGLSERYLEKVIIKAPHCYKKYSIPKKSGGTRLIFHPSAELKVIQRWLTENFFSKLPIHDSVYSYVKTKNILQNASKHKSNNFLLRLDFENFFPSIKLDDVKKLCSLYRENTLPFVLSDDDIKIICKLVCRYDKELNTSSITIGAPSSPTISNAILYTHDCAIDAYCRSRNITYTRYADDLFFSTNTPGILKEITAFIVSIIDSHEYPKLVLNHSKSVFTSKKRLRKITGLVITTENKTSVGRDYKRKIRTEVFLSINGKLDQDRLLKLKGKLAYCKSVDPDFVQSLITKFGIDKISNLLTCT